MKRLWNVVGLLLIMSWPLSLWAATAPAPAFQVGKDYQIITPPTTLPAIVNPPGKVSVVEFFSYGCPWCYKLESDLEPWLKTAPSDVNFARVPVVFEPNWTILARAYYVAYALGVQDKITPAIFKALHEQGLKINNAQDLENFFVQQGVSKQDVESALNSSPAIDMDMAKGSALMRQYQIVAIPTIIVDGKYMTNLMLTNGDTKKLVQIVNYLVTLNPPAANTTPKAA